MKKSFLPILILFLLLCPVSYAQQKAGLPPLKGQTRLEYSMQEDIIRSVYETASVFNKNCQRYNVVDTQISGNLKGEKIENGVYVKGRWSEIWIVDRCSMRLEIPIFFRYDRNGGVKFLIFPSLIQTVKLKY